MRVALVVNPTSGKRRGEQIAREAMQTLADAGHAVKVVRGDDTAEARTRLDDAIDRARPDLVVVVGGDGALHGLLPTLVAHDLTAAMIPAGTGNDVARQLGVRDPREATRAILEGRTRPVDLIDVGDGEFVATVVASGFDSKVNERANAMTWPRGNMRYNLAILAELREFQPLRFTLEADGQALEREAMLVAVANMPSFGGGLRIGEGADDADGLLDVVVIHPVSKLRLMRVFPMLYRGTHIHLPEFERIRAKTVTWAAPGIVGYGDGERLGSLPITARAVPGALRMIVGTP